MNWKRIIGLLLGAALIAFVVIKLISNKEVAQDRVYQYDKEQAINVRVDSIRYEFIGDELSYSGTFEPNKESKLSSELQGKINAIFVDVGSYVKKGQSLIQLDNSLLKLQLQTVEVQIEGLEADFERYQILVKADAIQGVQLEKAELGLKSAKVQKATLLEQISKTIIKAPFDGVITAKLSEVGSFAAPGVPLLQLTDISTLKFTVNIPESALSNFKLNNTYSIKADVYPDFALDASLIMVGSKANMGSSFPVQFKVKNTSDFKIKSGMFGKAFLSNENQEKGIMIPASAIVGTSNQQQVYLVKDNKAVLQNISVSERIQNKALISSGLKAGDVIITNGFINLYDGANVSIKN
ncbi:MAG: efflux RND transporter periplasmic adaptor subunit [Ignavibacteriae bacterium HGW-Ignavibacteriae-1]|jgi:RND family efflux transporter MFP subunit|nr:MAG: efflux RND transporter periplasmic adaptor subunit [Ignavibacteriae bacterium HGW-Ignavibacteriae-1]